MPWMVCTHTASMTQTHKEATVKIFLVEDSVPIRERLVEAIDSIGGHTVVGEAASYQEAVEGIADSRPDIAIFDIKLSPGNGIEALVAAKRIHPPLRGIVMSNYTTPQHMKASSDAGAEYFLDKSADFDKLLDILSAMADRPLTRQ